MRVKIPKYLTATGLQSQQTLYRGKLYSLQTCWLNTKYHTNLCKNAASNLSSDVRNNDKQHG